MELDQLRKTYDATTYLDQYGGSVALFALLTFLFAWIIIYASLRTMSQPIKDNWAAQRCHPAVIPVAGWIHHPDNMTASEYTSANFQYCMQTVLSGITGTAVSPLTFMTSLLHSIFSAIQQSIQSVRGMFDKVRTSMQDVSVEIMGRLLNIMTPIIRMVIAFKDITAKVQGTATASLFTFMGSFLALKSLMGVIAQSILEILIALSVMIAVLWAVPFTWGAAVANTSIFVAIAVPMAMILTFMTKTLNVQPGLRIPKLKCFHPATNIILHDGTSKRIDHISAGDTLRGGSNVKALMEVITTNSTLYTLDEIIVSDTHCVIEQGEIMRVSAHPCAKKMNPSEEIPRTLWCLITSDKSIPVANTSRHFCDWDDCLSTKLSPEIPPGYLPSANILTDNLGLVPIAQISVGDLLYGGSLVYGVVWSRDGNRPKMHLMTTSGYIYAEVPRTVAHESYVKIFPDFEMERTGSC